ncbi:hypothetical protein THAOC_12923, partial [Thalassiosira oceanica]
MLSRATRAGSVGVSNSTPASLLGLGASRNSSSETLASRRDLRPKGGGSSGADGSYTSSTAQWVEGRLKSRGVACLTAEAKHSLIARGGISSGSSRTGSASSGLSSCGLVGSRITLVAHAAHARKFRRRGEVFCVFRCNLYACVGNGQGWRVNHVLTLHCARVMSESRDRTNRTKGRSR